MSFRSIFILAVFILLSTSLVVTAQEDENGEKNNEDNIQNTEEIQNTEDNIQNFRIKGTRLDDLIRMLGRKADINLMLTQPMEEEGTLEFKDSFSPMKLIEVLTEAYGYELQKDENIYRVIKKQGGSGHGHGHNQQTQQHTVVGHDGHGHGHGHSQGIDKGKTFELQNHPVEKVEDKLRKMLSPKGKLETNTTANAVYVVDTKKVQDEIGAYIEFLNKETTSRARFTEKVFNLNRLEPKAVELKVREMLKNNGGEVYINEKSRKMVVYGTIENIRKVEKYLQNVDVPEPQVYIECKFVEVSMTAGTEIGARYQLQKAVGGNGTAINDVNFLPVNTTAVLGVQDTNIFTFVDDDFQIDFSTLATNSNTRLLANPNLLSNNRETATINVITKVPFIQAQVRNSDNEDVTQQIEFEEVGVRLTITPEVYGDGSIRLRITPEVSEVVDFILGVPVTKRKTIEASVTIKDGQRMVMGGLLEDQIRKTRTKIPILGDMPLLGFLFSREEEDIVKTELLIFLEASIVNADTITKMGQSAEQRLQKRHEQFDTHFEFYPNLREGLDTYDIAPEKKDPFGFTFEPYEEK